jgi:hypothetical protein
MQAGAALKSVIYFLELDPTCVQFRLTRTLASLLNALHDASQGAKPPLLYARRPNEKSGAPTHKTESILRGQIILMLHMLLHVKVPECEACAGIASVLKKAGVRHKKSVEQPDGKLIEPSQIANWRHEYKGKSIKGSDAVYEQLKEDEVARRGWPATREEA